MRRDFLLPEKNGDNKRIFAYLRKRGIDYEIINHFIKHGYIYEQKERHNAVFVGRDKDGNARYAALRGTYSDSVFVGEASGSDKRYSFSVNYNDSGTLHVYESAIDLLSFLTLRKMTGADWRAGAHLSLGSVHKSERREGNKLPPALERYLNDYPDITTIVLLLDSDETGRNAASNISELIPNKVVINRFPKGVKDINELLQQTLQINSSVKMRGNKHKVGDAR